MSKTHADLYEDLNSPTKAYTIRRHLETGDLLSAQYVARMNPEVFEEADRLLWQWFLFGVAVGITAND